MTKYCATCFNEYQDTLNNCPDDGATLTTQKPTPPKPTVGIDIYAAAEEVDAEQIVMLLRNAGIGAAKANVNITPIPVVNEAHILISVAQSHRERAIELIRQAKVDQIISNSGRFL